MEEPSFGLWLSRRRKSLGLTQKQLAERVNCATITIRKIEAEQRRPSLQIIERLAQTCNVPREEHAAFYQFARGYKPLSPAFEAENDPWHPASGTLRAEMLSSLVMHIEHAHAFPDINRVYLNENVYLVNQLEAPAESSGSSPLEITHDTLPNSQNRRYYLLLVPLELPNGIAQAYMPEPALQNVSVQAPSRMKKSG